MQPILLASSSTYRRSLLTKLGIPFEWLSPDIDESPIENESAEDMVRRLSLAKAKAMAFEHPTKLIIGSDQVALLDGKIIGKPRTHERATAQLMAASGRIVTFKTGLCLLNAYTGRTQIAVDNFNVHFRTLTYKQIEHYLLLEKPYDCAGSFKVEGLGISLFTKLSGDDSNALIGLPLILLVSMLANEGIDPLSVDFNLQSSECDANVKFHQ